MQQRLAHGEACKLPACVHAKVVCHAAHWNLKHACIGGCKVYIIWLVPCLLPLPSSLRMHGGVWLQIIPTADELLCLEEPYLPPNT